MQSVYSTAPADWTGGSHSWVWSSVDVLRKKAVGLEHLSGVGNI